MNDGNYQGEVCIASYMYWPIITGKGTRHPRVLSEMLQYSFKVKVITRHITNEKSKWIKEQDDGGIQVIRIPHLWFKGAGYLPRALTYLSFSLACLRAIRYIKEGDVFFTVYPEPPYFALTTPILKLVSECKHIALITDLLPDTAYDMGIVKNRLLKKAISWFCIRSYHRIDRIIVITEAIRERLTQYGIDPRKIFVVELAVDTHLFRPAAVDWTSLNLPQLENKFVVLYSGSFGNMYDFGLLLEAAKDIEAITDKIHFVIRGDGDQREWIEKMVSKLNLRNTTLLGPVAATETVIAFINSASVCVIPMREAEKIDMTHPSKLLECWSCAKPVICTTRGETAKLIARFNAGIAVQPNDTQALVEAILKIYNDKPLAASLGRNARENVVNHLSIEKIREKLTRAIDVDVDPPLER
jgi:colanic acid biosynthesis glycosyl transferase WcaI